tara:strand:+ start:876 stop:1082 length:207 start_codon:yes stop_codon:yes gene_type:complete
MYEIWYIPRIHDEVLMWKFKTISDAQISMKRLKEERPKAWPHFYIWNTKTKKKIKYEEPFDDFGWWGS